MQYTEKELEQLINEVEKEFTSHLAKAEENFRLAKSEDSAAPKEEPLVKAEEGEKKPEEKPEAKEEPKGEESKEEKKPEAKEAEAEAKEEGEKAPEGEKKPEAEAAPKEDGEGHDYDEKDLEHMDKMYMSMSKGELKAHHDSVRKALDASMAKCGDMSMSKSETAATSVEVKPEIVKDESNKELELLKSEIAAEKAKTEGLQKSLDAVSAFLTKLVEKKVAPQGKAITSLDVIAKSEGAQEEKSLTKGEIDTILNQKAQDPKLEKSDRDAINAFYLSNGSINSISHLLK